MAIPLPRYNQCKYSLFVSYAHDDDTATNGWVSQLAQSIKERMHHLGKDLPRLALHLSGKNGPVSGSLGDELESRIDESFAMLLVVGKKYAGSGWCEKELAYFFKRYGKAGLDKRLFIAVMTEPDYKAVRSGQQWSRLIRDDQLWVPFFDASAPDEPLEHLSGDGKTAPKFFNQASRIARKLNEVIESDHQADYQASQSAGVPGSTPLKTPWSAASTEPLRVAIGPFTDNLAVAARELKAALEGAGASAKVLARSIVDDFDPDSDAALRPALQDADILVVPVVDSRPLCPTVPGGHVAILTNEWKALNKARPIVWYRPGSVAIEPGEAAAQKHREIFARLAPVCASQEAVANLLFGVGHLKPVKVFIEFHQKAPVLWDLSRKLGEIWNSLPGAADRPPLKCEALHLNKLESTAEAAAGNGLKPVAREVAGVILLFPRGYKNYDSLCSQAELAERYFPHGDSAFPGIVALFYKSEDEIEDAPTWPIVQFIKHDHPNALFIDPDSQRWLESFLAGLLAQHRSTALGAPRQ